MAHTPRDWSPLRNSLLGAEQLSQQMLALLQTEREHLEQRDYAAFEQLLGKKNALVQALLHNTNERRQWLQQHGYADDTAALAELKLGAPDISACWHQLAKLWQQCQHASQINEQISQRTRLVVSRLLDVLSGNAGQGSTYNGKGATQRMQTGRTITSA